MNATWVTEKINAKSQNLFNECHCLFTSYGDGLKICYLSKRLTQTERNNK